MLEAVRFRGEPVVAQPAPYSPLPPGEGGVRAGRSQGERLRFLDCHPLS